MAIVLFWILNVYNCCFENLCVIELEIKLKLVKIELIIIKSQQQNATNTQKSCRKIPHISCDREKEFREKSSIATPLTSNEI